MIIITYCEGWHPKDRTFYCACGESLTVYKSIFGRAKKYGFNEIYPFYERECRDKKKVSTLEGFQKYFSKYFPGDKLCPEGICQYCFKGVYHYHDIGQARF